MVESANGDPLGKASWSSLVAQQLKDLALPLLWLWCDPWPWELLHAAGAAKGGKRKKGGPGLIVYFIEKISVYKWTVQFKPVLFKGQLYIALK